MPATTQQLRQWPLWLSVPVIALLAGLYLLSGNPNYLALPLLAAGLITFAELFIFRKQQLLYLIILMAPLSVTMTLGGFAIGIPSEALTAIMAAYFLLRTIAKPTVDRKIALHPLSLLLLFDTLWLSLTAALSSDPLVSFKRLAMRVAFLLVFYLLFAHLFKKPKNIVRLFVLYALSYGVVVVYTMKNHAHYNFIKNISSLMPKPFYDDHTIYGAVGAFLLPILVMLLFRAKTFAFTQLQRLGLLILSLATLTGFIFSYSRAAWLSMAVALVFLVFIKLKIKFGYLMGALLIIAAVLFANHEALILKVKQNDAISNKDNTLEHVESISNINSDVSNTERINRWTCAVRMFKDRPLTGWGPGTYQFEYGKYQTAGLTTYLSTSLGNKGNAHSEYLTYLSESGWPALLSYLLIVFATIAIGLKVVYRTNDKRLKYLATALLLSLVTFYVHGLVNTFIDMIKMSILVFGSMAALVVLEQYHLKKPVADEA